MRMVYLVTLGRWHTHRGWVTASYSTCAPRAINAPFITVKRKQTGSAFDRPLFLSLSLSLSLSLALSCSPIYRVNCVTVTFFSFSHRAHSMVLTLHSGEYASLFTFQEHWSRLWVRTNVHTRRTFFALLNVSLHSPSPVCMWTCLLSSFFLLHLSPLHRSHLLSLLDKVTQEKVALITFSMSLSLSPSPSLTLFLLLSVH